jgi:hypothetical protein
MGGTPEFLTDPRRGLYSYEALHSRLAENAFATGALRDLSGPVIRLASLTPEELFVLLGKLRTVQAGGQDDSERLPDAALEAFMQHCSGRLGETYFRTPRTTIKAFVQLMAVLDQNPETDWRELLGAVTIEPDRDPQVDLVMRPDDDASGNDEDEELASFRL